jgi:hypothetical protein
MMKSPLVLLILGAALSAPSWADDEHTYGRVIRVEPSGSFGYDDGRGQYQIQFELGGQRYWTQSDSYPGPWIEVPTRGEHEEHHGDYDREEHHEHHRWHHHDDDD